MEHLEFDFTPGTAEHADAGGARAVLVGVVSSGNLEVLVEHAALGGAARVVIDTTVRGYRPVWHAVLTDFFTRHPLHNVRISINDAGATPAVVGLRLDQAAAELRQVRP